MGRPILKCAWLIGREGIADFRSLQDACAKPQQSRAKSRAVHLLLCCCEASRAWIAQRAALLRQALP